MAVTARFSVTLRQVREDESEAPLDGSGRRWPAPAEQFAGLAAWAVSGQGTSITGAG